MFGFGRAESSECDGDACSCKCYNEASVDGGCPLQVATDVDLYRFKIGEYFIKELINLRFREIFLEFLYVF